MLQAVNDLFANATIRRALFRARFLLAGVALIPLAYFMEPRLLPLGFALSMLGQAIQTWCFAALVKNREFTVRGPYVIVRNPMYLGRYLLLLGFVLLPGNVPLVVVFTVLYVLYMVNRVRREETRLRRTFGEQYARYCAEVRGFVPSLSRLGDPRVRFFDWAMFHENNAHWNLVSTLGAFVALFLVRRAGL